MFMNREQKVGRRISNMNEVIAWARQEYPCVAWEKQKGPMTGLKEAAVVFNDVKFYFSAHGADLTNIVFMQPRGVVCEVHGIRLYPLFSGMSRMFGLLHVGARLAGLVHWCEPACEAKVLPLDVARRMIGAGMEFLETGNLRQ
jgi:hypothetical protein